MRARRSASSSHALTCRIASSRAGIPVGKRDRSRPSRSTAGFWPPVECRTRRTRPTPEALGALAPLAFDALRAIAPVLRLDTPLLVARVAVLLRALAGFEDPATP